MFFFCPAQYSQWRSPVHQVQVKLNLIVLHKFQVQLHFQFTLQIGKKSACSHIITYRYNQFSHGYWTLLQKTSTNKWYSVAAK